MKEIYCKVGKERKNKSVYIYEEYGAGGKNPFKTYHFLVTGYK